MDCASKKEEYVLYFSSDFKCEDSWVMSAVLVGDSGDGGRGKESRRVSASCTSSENETFFFGLFLSLLAMLLGEVLRSISSTGVEECDLVTESECENIESMEDRELDMIDAIELRAELMTVGSAEKDANSTCDSAFW